MVIKKFVVHRIEKKSHSSPQLFLAEKELPTDESNVETFATETIGIFDNRRDKPTSVFTAFHADEINFPFAPKCRDLFGGKISFLDFTKFSMNRLISIMDSQPLSTGGYVVFVYYHVEEIRYLLVAMLHKQIGFSIDDTTLSITDVSHLEMKNIDKAAVVNGGPEDGEMGDPPLTYSGFRKTLSQYFQQFLGPDYFRNPHRDSNQLIICLDNYADKTGIPRSRLSEIQTQVREYVKTQSNTNDDIDLEVISTYVDPGNPTAFSQFAQQEKISAHFKADPKVFRRWKTLKYRSNSGISLEFPVEEINRSIILDKESKSLTITNVEQPLIDDILKYQ